MSHLVLKSVPSSLQVHVFSVGIIKTAFTEFTMKSNHFPIIVTDLEEKQKLK